MPVGDQYRVRVRLAGGVPAELRLMVSDKICHSVVEAYADLQQDQTALWEGRVVIAVPTIFGMSIPGIEPDVNAADDPRWERLLLRIAFPTLVHMAESDSLPSATHCLTDDEIQAHIDDFGFEGRNCESLDSSNPLRLRCRIAVDEGIDAAINQPTCDQCAWPEFFERCRHMQLVEVYETRGTDGPPISIETGCRKGLLRRAEPPCRTRDCYEPWELSAPTSSVSEKTLAVFSRMLANVERELAEAYPKTFAELNTAYDRFTPGASSGELAQAAASCRRVLNDLADSLFPPQDHQYKDHDVGQRDYVNRLWAYADKRMGSETNSVLLGAGLSHLGARIDAVYKLACKGTHDEWTAEEARRCVVHLYLLVADLLAL